MPFTPTFSRYNLLTAGIVMLAAWGLAVCGVFSYAWFNLFGFNPLALDFYYGKITEAELFNTFIPPVFFNIEEVQHLADVKRWLWGITLATLTLTPLAAALLYWRLDHAAEILKLTLWLQGVYLFVKMLIWSVGGFKLLSQLYHLVFFPLNSWKFPPDSATRMLYGNKVMETGAVSLIILSTLLLIVLYLVLSVMEKRK